MPTKDLHKDAPFDSATLSKLEIFENYLSEWLPTFVYNKNINICDFFSGPGEDINHVSGSPLRIINVIQKFEDLIKKQQLQITLFLNDKTKWKYEAIKKNVSKKLLLLGDLQNHITVKYFNCKFQNLFPLIKDDLISGPNLFFFDQNGVRHITIDFIQELESFNQTDYLFFLSSAYFKRFSYKSIFPDLNIKKKEIKSKDIHREIVERFRELLPANSKTRLYYFSIKKGRNIHGLVFGSTHLLAIQKFLTVAWNKNKVNGEANFDIDSDLDTQMDLFSGEAKTTKLQQFENDLKEFIKNKKVFTNQDIFNYTLDRAFIPKHANAVLKKLKKSNQLENFSHAKIGYKQIYKEKDIITFRYKK